MGESIGKLTVYFENPFWVGVFERIEDEKLSVCKVTFGAEPKDYEVLEFVLKNYSQLKFSPSVDVEVRKEAKKSEANTKRSTKTSYSVRYRNKIATGIATAARRKTQREINSEKTLRHITLSKSFCLS